jgi:hypothetical protein
MRKPVNEFNRGGKVLQYGYVLQWADGTLQAETFRSNRHDCWFAMVATERGRRQWKAVGVRCVPARRTISAEEPK